MQDAVNEDCMHPHLNITENISTHLLYQVKTQYLYIYKKVDTSIEHQISVQSTTVVKGCMYICLMQQILPLVMEEH